MDTKHLISISALLVLSVNGTAQAQEAAVRTAATPDVLAMRDTDAADVPAEDSVRTTRGLYVRGGLGFGGMGNNVIGAQENTAGEQPEGTITGMGMTSELTLGTSSPARQTARRWHSAPGSRSGSARTSGWMTVAYNE